MSSSAAYALCRRHVYPGCLICVDICSVKAPWLKILLTFPLCHQLAAVLIVDFGPILSTYMESVRGNSSVNCSPIKHLFLSLSLTLTLALSLSLSRHTHTLAYDRSFSCLGLCTEAFRLEYSQVKIEQSAKSSRTVKREACS